MHSDHESLAHKLGYAAGDAVDTVDAPDWFMEYLRGNGVHTHAKLPTEWLHMFMTSLVQTEHFLAHLKFNEIQKGLWVSWPRSGQQQHTDITERGLQRIMEPHGWVSAERTDIDQHWQALKFVRED